MEYKLSYDVTKEDYLKYNDVHARKNMSSYFMLVALKTFVVLCSAIMIYFQVRSHQFTYSLIIPILIMGYAFFGRKLLRNKYLGKIYDSNKNIHQQNEVTIDENNISEKNSVSSMNLTKDQITEIVACKNGIYIYFSKVQCILIPSHAFENDQAFETFVEFVRTNYSSDSVKFCRFTKNKLSHVFLGILTGIVFFSVFIYFSMH